MSNQDEGDLLPKEDEDPARGFKPEDNFTSHSSDPISADGKVDLASKPLLRAAGFVVNEDTDTLQMSFNRRPSKLEAWQVYYEVRGWLEGQDVRTDKLSITLTPSWKRLLSSMNPEELKTIVIPGEGINHVVCRMDDFTTLCKMAGVQPNLPRHASPIAVPRR